MSGWSVGSSYGLLVGASTSQPPVDPGTDTARMPVSYPDANTAAADLNVPSDANLVVWNPAWTNLEQAFRALSANDILVLPERPEPYWVDSQWGFPAAGVGSVRGMNGVWLPVSPTWNGMTARTWFAMARARRGVLGLGPGAVIQTTDSGWTMEPQIQDAGSTESNGWVSTGRYWRNTSDVIQSELVGCQEKVLEAEHNDSYFGNFTMLGRDFGGIAYSGIASKGGTVERIHANASWRGFQGVPNGESGAISVATRSYLISRCTLNPVSDGQRVGSSPIMINTSPGGRIEYVTADMTRVGMPTLWRVSGLHEIIELSSRWGLGPGLNLEQIQPNSHIKIVGGAFWPNRQNLGGKGSSPDGQFGNGLHISLGAEGPMTLEVIDLDIDHCLVTNQLSIQGYANTPTHRPDIIVTHKMNGVDLPWRIY